MIKRIIRGVIWGTILSFVYLVGCTNTPADKQVEEFVKDFEKEVGTSTKGVDFYFTKLKKPVVGRCFPGLKIIQLDLEFFKNSSTINRKALVYHELGHCACTILIHAKESAFCGDSLMVPSMLGEWCYRTSWSKYTKDLRERCK